jgi:hypothetical protein
MKRGTLAFLLMASALFSLWQAHQIVSLKWQICALGAFPS